MKNLTLKTAINLGFDFENSEFEDKKELEQQVIEFLNDNVEKLPKKYDHHEISQHGKNQFINWGSFDFEDSYSSSGELFDFSDRDFQNAKKGSRFYYTNFLVIDKQGKCFNMNLYFKK
jgi:hypothetical protein